MIMNMLHLLYDARRSQVFTREVRAFEARFTVARGGREDFMLHTQNEVFSGPIERFPLSEN